MSRRLRLNTDIAAAARALRHVVPPGEMEGFVVHRRAEPSPTGAFAIHGAAWRGKSKSPQPERALMTLGPGRTRTKHQRSMRWVVARCSTVVREAAPHRRQRSGFAWRQQLRTVMPWSKPDLPECDESPPPRPPIVGHPCGSSATLSTPELAVSGYGGMRENWAAQNLWAIIEELAGGTL